jgi:hypothetical protein
MKTIFFILLAISAVTAAVDPLAPRFSAATISALKDGKQTTMFVLEGDPPPPHYLKNEKKFNLSDVESWLQKQRKNERKLSATGYLALRELLLTPKNHYQGLFTVFESASCAIAFHFDGKTGYILLYQSDSVAVIWEDKWETALLNETGRKALEVWKKENR